MNNIKDRVYREDKPASKKEVTNVATALNEENERLIGRIKALEAEVRGLKKVESWYYKAWKNIKWWYTMDVHWIVVEGLKWSAGIVVGVYIVYKLGMEFIPTVMGPVSNVVGRAISALLSF